MLFTWVGNQRRAPIAKGERATCRDLLAAVMSVEREWAVAGDPHWLIAGFLQAMTHAEQKLFPAYFKAYRSVLGEALPALLRQVYLHSDPAVTKRRDGRWREIRREWLSVGFVGRAAT